jgi:hypothetical protein
MVVETIGKAMLKKRSKPRLLDQYYRNHESVSCELVCGYTQLVTLPVTIWSFREFLAALNGTRRTNANVTLFDPIDQRNLETTTFR